MGEQSERIAADLRALGVKAGGVLLVHSSFKSLGPVPGGPPRCGTPASCGPSPAWNRG